MRLKHTGKGYRGHDFDGKSLVAETGQVIECSDRRGVMLLHDYPGGFEKVGAAPAGTALAAGDAPASAPTLSQPKRKRRK